MTVVTVASCKGGTGKTTTAVSLAAHLATLAPTLLIDLDSQGHASLSLGLDARSGVFDWLVAEQPLSNCVQLAGDGLTLLPGNSRTKLVDTYYRERSGGFDQLIDRIRNLPARWVILDTAPGGMVQEAALAAADHVIVPFECEALGIDGAVATLALVERLARSAKLTLLPTSFDKRLSEHKHGLREMIEEYGSVHVSEPIPARSAVKAAAAFGETIWVHKHPGLADVRTAYATLAARILAQHGDKEEATLHVT